MRRRELPGGVAPPTKTALKREAEDVQRLADRLIAAPGEQIERLGLPERLADAIAQARRLRAGGARSRQRLFVAKLMRRLDLEPVRRELERQADAARLAAARNRRAERLRDGLIEGGDAQVEAFAAAFGADRAALRRLVSAATTERRSGRPAGAGRRLFRFVLAALATES